MHRRPLSPLAPLAALGLVVLLLPVVACEKKEGAESAVAKGPDQPTAAAHDDHGAHGAASNPAAGGKKTALGLGETPTERDQVDADGVVRRGHELPKEGEKLSVAQCEKKAEDLNGQQVMISGQVARVCAKKGCWWAIEDKDHPGRSIRITHKDYAFFVPASAKGKQAVAFGKLEVKKLSPEEAAHLAEDEGLKDVDPATLPKVELRLEATALEMRG